MRITKKDIPFILCLFLLGLFFFLFYTWAIPLMDPDEPRYAATARGMVLDNNWIVPFFNGEPRINKPPLFYWMVACSYKVFGINEFGARFPSAMAAIGTVLITYLLGKRYESRKSGFWAGMVLISSPLFFLVSRLCITDILLTFFISASLYLFFVEYPEKNKNMPRKCFLFFLLGMVFLVKGPVGVLLVVLTILCFLAWMRDLRFVRKLWYLPGFLLFLGVICAWGIPFWLSLGTKQIFGLITQETTGRIIHGYAHQEPFYYYLPVILAGYFPWSLFLCAVFFNIFKKRTVLPVEEKRRVYFFCIWFVLALVFFSLSRSKLMTYILPISPAIALLTISLYRWEKEGIAGKSIRWISWLSLGFSVALPMVLISTMSKWVPANYTMPTYHVVIPVMILFIVAPTAFYAIYYKKGFLSLLKVYCFTHGLFLLAVIIFVVTYVGTFRSTRDIVNKSHLYETNDCTLLSYAKTLPSLVFYSDRNVIEINPDASLQTANFDKGKPIYFVMTLHSFQKKKDWLLRNSFHIVDRDSAYIVLKSEK